MKIDKITDELLGLVLDELKEDSAFIANQIKVDESEFYDKFPFNLEE